jgi:ferritin
MLQEPVLNALQIQMGHELNNSYQYKAFSGIADYQSLIGACSWFDKQSDEERGHFNKFFSYICDKGYVPHLQTLNEITPNILAIDALFAETVHLEQQTLTNLQLLAQVCVEAKDDQTYELVLWFLKEQVEECKTVEDLHKRCLMSLNNILIFDNELAQR